MRVALIVPLLAGLGCAAAPGPSGRVWNEDLPAAIREADRKKKPLLVLSIVGDIQKRC